ncbi:MAG TPA: dipeptidase [Bryobacteraceae bacterium]|nr:dipeptidase [Bryobacteraceae bacterium]
MRARITAEVLLCAALMGAQPRAVHRSMLLIDTHSDWPNAIVKARAGKPPKATHTDATRLRAGNVGGLFFAAYVPADYAKTPGASARRARELIELIRTDIIERYPGTFAFARTASDIEAARRAGKIAALIGIEGGHVIENSLAPLREFRDAGVRYITLTHSNTNRWADSSGDMKKADVERHGGLTAFGREVVREMNRLGIMVDISHVSDDTFYQALEITRAPLIASHSSCRALTGHARNMTDDMIRALAKKHGVIHINFACEFTSPESLVASERRPKPEVIPRATLAQVVAHIDHAVKTGGIDSVGIGSDFDGITCTPEGLDDVSNFPSLTRALLDKGYTDAQIRKIYGQNTLRVMREVERAAAR